MEENNKTVNTLIKRNRLVLRMKKAGIKRVSLNALALLEGYLQRNVDKMMDSLKEEMIIGGRKTLKKSDVEKVLEQIKKEENFWED